MNSKTWTERARGVADYNAFFSIHYVRLPEIPNDLHEKSKERTTIEKKYAKRDPPIINDRMPEAPKESETHEILEVVDTQSNNRSWR